MTAEHGLPYSYESVSVAMGILLGFTIGLIVGCIYGYKHHKLTEEILYTRIHTMMPVIYVVAVAIGMLGIYLALRDWQDEKKKVGKNEPT